MLSHQRKIGFLTYFFEGLINKKIYQKNYVGLI